MNQSDIKRKGEILRDPKEPLKVRFRTLFELRHIGGEEAINHISEAFKDDSALLKHELAYCLGQMQDVKAIPTLCRVLADTKEDPMVRHEAGEALGAIGSPEVLELLEGYCKDPVVEVAETCQLAVERIKWLKSGAGEHEKLSKNPFSSVDPAPPCEDTDVEKLGELLLNENESLFTRYRAMFALRNSSKTEAVLQLAKGLRCKSALFRHEIGYVLGQLQNDAAVEALAVALRDAQESPMVRHECAEALGSIGNKKCMDILEKYKQDPDRVVKESCVVALDIADPENLVTVTE